MEIMQVTQEWINLRQAIDLWRTAAVYASAYR
jgi:plasmid maintenance system antidote protein VapI